MNGVKLLGVLAGGVVLALGWGCQEYATYPAVPTSHGMSESLNNPASEAAMVAALQYVATRYPPGTPKEEAKTAAEAGRTSADYPLAVELPVGMRKSFYERIAHHVGPEAVPLTPSVLEDKKLPIYHVSRVWMRFHTGTIDVLRPMPELGPGPDGQPVYQKVTVRLEGGFEPWRVIHARAWEPGTDAAPEPYFLPDIERIDQYEYSTKGGDKAAPQLGEAKPNKQERDTTVYWPPLEGLPPAPSGAGPR